MEVLTSGARGEISEEEARNPLPAKVLALRKRSFAVFVYNLSPPISVENCKGGWDGLVVFADEREQQNKGQIGSSKSKQRSSTKLQGLRCSINYDKGRSWQSQNCGLT